MKTEIIINGNLSPDVNYVSWAPAECQITLTEADGATSPIRVILRNQNASRGGQVAFFDVIPGTEQDELQLDLPIDGTPIDFFIAGKFGSPSFADKDTVIEVIDTSSGSILSETTLMVRIRKNANNLTTDERDRFLSALAILNDRGMGGFTDFRDMHRAVADEEAHRRAGFLPWHRAYLLDLERELQNIDPSVTLPYWRFDKPAPRLFTRDFIGVATRNGTVDFAASNPLVSWTTDMSLGIVRQPEFNTRNEPATDTSSGLGVVLDEESTIDLGEIYLDFWRPMELNPHGYAHVSFSGYLEDPDTAPKDPLFFLLHTNVDRLWAKWQWINRRFDITSSDTYSFLGSAGNPGSTRVGHNLNDTMWPWNQVTSATDPNRPPTAPGGNFPNSLIVNTPDLTPRVREMIDYQGVLNPASRLGFDYDDVPFEF